MRRYVSGKADQDERFDVTGYRNRQFTWTHARIAALKMETLRYANPIDQCIIHLACERHVRDLLREDEADQTRDEVLRIRPPSRKSGGSLRCSLTKSRSETGDRLAAVFRGR
jgi:hypothetical protein